jgi:hypothetical protein
VIAEQLLDLHPGTCKLPEDLSITALRHLWNLEDIYILLIHEERPQFSTVFATHTCFPRSLYIKREPCIQPALLPPLEKGTCQNQTVPCFV